MTPDDVISIYAALADAGVETWIDGGWAVDALIGTQTRSHDDLDIAIRSAHVTALRSCLADRGFGRETVGVRADAWNFVLNDDHGRQVDVHVFVLDDRGRVIDGIKYPEGSLTGTGTIAGQDVRCLSATHLIWFKKHYKPRDKDRHDAAMLCRKYNIENPFSQ